MAARSKQDEQGRCRVRAARLRGVFSMGLLVKPDADMSEGDEVSAVAAIQKKTDS